MQSFFFKRQPYTFNSWKGASETKKNNYRTLIKESFSQFNTHNVLPDELYGTVYHFYNRNLNIDADNLSKPLWDCLTGFLFTDDRQVKIRIAGSFDLSENDLTMLDFTRLAPEIITELLEAFETNDHIVYVECGIINYSMFKFNIEINEN